MLSLILGGHKKIVSEKPHRVKLGGGRRYWQFGSTRKSIKKILLSETSTPNEPATHRRVDKALTWLEDSLSIEVGGLEAPSDMVSPEQLHDELEVLKRALSTQERLLAKASKSMRDGISIVQRTGVLRDVSGFRTNPFLDVLREIRKITHFVETCIDEINQAESETAVAQITVPALKGRPKSYITERVALLCGVAYENATGKVAKRRVAVEDNQRSQLEGQEYGPFKEFIEVCVLALKNKLPDLSARSIMEKSVALGRERRKKESKISK